MDTTPTKYTYSFLVWPGERTGGWTGLGLCCEVYEVFIRLNTRVEMVFTENEFETFRSRLGVDGFSLPDMERVPYHDPEAIP